VVVVIMVVVVFVPVALGVPAMRVFIPPAVVMAPAEFAGLVQFDAGMASLRTIPAVVFGRFVQVMIGADDAPLASMFIGGRARRPRQKQESADSGRG
jgi:hypothetical protein